MNCLEWDDGLQVGVKHIDDQNKHLFGLLDKIASISSSSEQTNNTGNFSYSQAVKMSPITAELIDQVINSFIKDEQTMNELGYPELALQEQQHLDFVKMLIVEFDLHPMNIIPSIEILVNLANLLRCHIMTEDKKYAAYLYDNGNKCTR